MRRFRLPPDSSLDAATWSSRHRLMVAVLGVQAVVIAAWLALQGVSPWHFGADLSPLVAAGVLAQRQDAGRRLRSMAVALGLFTESALVVHLADGAVAVHFHYFVMLCLLAQYEDPAPFALGVGYVVVQHGLMGSLMPDAVYGDAAEAGRPWLWALVHGAFVLAASAALVAGWRANALIRVSDRRHRREAEDYLDIAGALLIAVDADDQATIRVANRRLCQVLGRPEAELIGRSYFDVVTAPDEREAARRSWARIRASDEDAHGGVERWIVTADGERRLVEWTMSVRRDAAGRMVNVLSSGEDVTERRAAEAQIARDQRDLAGLRRLAQDVASTEDARQPVLDRVLELGRAEFALLAEPSDCGDELVVTTATHEPLVGLAIRLDGDQPSGLRDAFTSGRPGFHAAGAGRWRVNPEVLARTGATAFAFEPVVSEGRPVAVLAVGWKAAVPDADSRERMMIALAADEAAVALQRLATMRRLEAAALTDALTGVPNRRAFDERLPVELARARRSGEPLAVAMLDLNDFKALNDREGHEAGDRLLREAATGWAGELRGTDVLARLGGDEFAILLPSCDRAAADHVAARLRVAAPHGPGCGVGVAVWDGLEDLDALVARADRALYEDKARTTRQRLASPSRLAALEASGLLQGSHSDELDDVTRTVRWLLDVPLALVSLVDADRQVFASQCGLEGWAAEQGGTPLSHSFCQHAVTTGRPLVVEDARESELLRDNRAIEDLSVIAYAGFPLSDAEGNVLGVLCAIDHEPRAWSPEDLVTLRRLAERAAAELAALGTRSLP